MSLDDVFFNHQRLRGRSHQTHFGGLVGIFTSVILQAIVLYVGALCHVKEHL